MGNRAYAVGVILVIVLAFLAFLTIGLLYFEPIYRSWVHPNSSDLGEEEKFSGYRFTPRIIYNDPSDSHLNINSEWYQNKVIWTDRASHISHEVKLNKEVMFEEFWTQIENDKYVSDWGGECSWSTVCFRTQNATAFLVIDFKESSIRIDEQQTLESNEVVLAINNFTDYEFENAKILTVDLQRIVDQWNNKGNYAYPSITIWIINDFTNTCIFSTDRDTCESTQMILRQLQVINEKLGIKNDQ